MAITADNLMRSSRDWDWVDYYADRMGEKELVEYSRNLFRFLHSLQDDSEIIIENIVKADNEDLFAKCVCRYSYEGTLNLCFSADFKKLRKLENGEKNSRHIKERRDPPGTSCEKKVDKV